MATKASNKQQATDFDFDLLDEIINDAPAAGFGPRVTYGKLTYKIDVIKWTGPKDNRTAKTTPYTSGMTVNKDAGEYLQITFNIDVQELNNALDWEWNRRVDVKKSNKQTGAVTDWSEIVEPSLIATIGKDWMKKCAAGRGVYVEAEEPVTVAKKKTYVDKNTGEEKNNTTVRILRAFKSKDECNAARELRFAKSNDSGDDDVELSIGIPDNIVNDVRGMMDAVSQTELETILKNTPPYNQYAYADLVAAASEEE